MSNLNYSCPAVNPVIQHIQEELAGSGGVLVGVATEQDIIELIRGNEVTTPINSTNGIYRMETIWTVHMI